MELAARVAVVTGAAAGLRREIALPRAPEEIADAVVRCIRDGPLSGRVLVMRPGEGPRPLDPGPGL